MINLSNIINIQTKQSSVNKIQSKKENMIEYKTNLPQEQKALPSAENYRAMFLSFGAKKTKPVLLPPSLTNMLLPEELNEQIEIKSYDKSADLIAQNSYKDKNSIVLYQKGSMPALVINNFAKNLIKGTYQNIGLTPENTEVYFLDANMAALSANEYLAEKIKLRTSDENNEDSYEKICKEEYEKPLPEIAAIQKLVEEKKDKNIFIFNSEPENFMFAPFSPNLKVVYLVEDQHKSNNKASAMINLLRQGEEEEEDLSQENLPKMAKAIIKTNPKTAVLTLPLVNATETKSFIKKYWDKLLNIPLNVNIPFSTIDFAVDKSKTREGVYPGKAISLINNAIPCVLLGKKIKPNMQYVSITSKNLETSMKKYPEAFEPEIDFSEKPYDLILDTKTKLSDIGGIEYEEKNIRETIINKVPNKKTKKSEIYPPSNILITGEAGSGKTLLVKAVAGELKSPLIHVSAVKLFNSMYMDMMGKGKQNFDIQEIFEFTKKTAHDSGNKTAVLFIDDLDAMVNKHNKLMHPILEEKNVKDIYLAELLNQIKSIDNKNSDINIIVMGSCRYPELMQEEFNKTGVFNERICVPDNRNNKDTRLSTLKILTKDKKFESEEEKKYILSETARITYGASGAELNTIINKASKLAEKRPDNKTLTINDMLVAVLEEVSGPVIQENRPEWKAKHHLKHELGHAVVSKALFNNSKETWQRPNEISFITFDSRRDYGAAVFYERGENGTLTFDSLINEIASAFGGYAVEKKLFNGRSTDGPSSDLEKINALAEIGVKKLSLGYHTGPLSNQELFKKENKKDITAIVETGEKVADIIVDFHKDFVEQYGNECFDNLGKAGNTLSAKVFDKRYNQWLDKDNRRNELKLVEAKIDILIDYARTKGKFLDDDKKLEKLAIKRLEKKSKSV